MASNSTYNTIDTSRFKKGRTMTIIDLFTVNTLLWGVVGILMAGVGIAQADVEHYKVENLYLGFAWAVVTYGVFIFIGLEEYQNYAIAILLVGSIKPRLAWNFLYEQTVERIKNKCMK